MTKLEFIDKINDILIGLNTAESDALGSLYDELMRDKNWQHYRIQAAIAAMQGQLANDESVKQMIETLDYVSLPDKTKAYMNLVAQSSVMLADALIAELQKKGGEDGRD